MANSVANTAAPTNARSGRSNGVRRQVISLWLNQRRSNRMVKATRTTRSRRSLGKTNSSTMFGRNANGSEKAATRKVHLATDSVAAARFVAAGELLTNSSESMLSRRTVEGVCTAIPLSTMPDLVLFDRHRGFRL